ncbi:MAG: ribokinase [Fibrella sp.]|nr:ribokinase [Armatimonadota bacterium]
MKNQIVVIGSSNADRIMQLPHLPAVGETVTDGVYSQAWGGKGANQAVAAARAGGNVVFLNAVGADAEGTAMTQSFAADGIGTSRMIVAPDVASGAALVLFDGEGRNYLAVAPGANYALRPEHIVANAEVIQSAAYIIMQMEIPVDTTLSALAMAQSAGVPVLFNFAPARTLDVPVSAAMTGLVVNENEATALSGITVTDRATAQSAGESLLAKGPRFVIVTLGADGAFVMSGDGLREHIPAFRVTPVDTTAAGDTFCGALTVALVEGKPLADACRFASAASALSVTKAGAQPSVPHRAEIEAFLVG